ncbi:MAG: sugar ABC transporter ATP-binding protein [Candidatus Eisenbacteria bacterium]|uniref:Sugar ABC transporter ATP-binding protein n=1 Tax=Eiseniibacteriota bacterium TaxID=2212470 RepID=A0A956RPP9_UNCEI|nr:sugar ABC transporter ATP-binding protein [Candidatus Eisenbacteria bacterium]
MSSPPNPDPGAGPALVFEGVTKTFPGVRALDDVSFTVARGSIHAIVGENGAGKSTLMKVLSGVHRPDAGSLRLWGQILELRTPAAAQDAGVAIVYQELTQVPHLSVAENVLLGRWPAGTGGVIDRTRLRTEARRWLDQVGLRVPPDQSTASLTVAQQQLLEIARALSLDARILVLDEPSAVLTPHELDGLFTLLRALRDDGRSILYISHRLEEIFALADRVTVLRDGTHVSTRPIGEVNHDTLIREMVGRTIDRASKRVPESEVDAVPGAATVTASGPATIPVPDATVGARPVPGLGIAAPGPSGADRVGALLRVEDLSWPGHLDRVTFSVAAGEVFAITGLVGAGRSSLLLSLFGATGPLTGRVELNGARGPFRSPRAAMRAGIVFLPEDRKRQGLLLQRSLQENASLASLAALARAGTIRRDLERNRTRTMMERLRIRAASSTVAVQTLSGGNQQKVLLARWLDRPHRAILFDEPTRGIDVGAKQEIHAWIRRLAEDGAAVVVSTSEIPEALAIADRIGVMRAGTIVAILDPRREKIDPETILRRAAGADRTDPISTAPRARGEDGRPRRAPR